MSSKALFIMFFIFYSCGVKKPPTHYAKDSITPWEKEYTDVKTPKKENPKKKN